MKIVHAIHQLRENIKHSASGLAVAAAVVAVAGLSAVPAQANTLTYPRSQTLGGWHERAYVGGTWTDLAPDVKSLVSTDGNGDLRGFTGGAGTATVWLRSPTFTLDASGDLTIATVYMAGSTMPASDASVPATKANGGIAGIALRDVSTGNFVLTQSAATSWAQVKFTAAELAPYVGQVLTVDLICQKAGDFYVNRPITVPGVICYPPSSILSFTFPTLGAATISGTNISITVPYGTDVSALTPVFTTSAGATCTNGFGGPTIVSGVTPVDFSSPVHYIVRSEDLGATTDYTVSVNSTSPSDPFAAWISGTFANGASVPVGQRGANDDPDNDSVNNLVEFAIAGMDPTVGNASPGTLNGKTLTFSKRQPLAAGLTYAIEESVDLGLIDRWETVPPTTDTTTEISYTLPDGPTKDFMRLKVTQNP